MRLLGDDGYPFIFAADDHITWQTEWLSVDESANEALVQQLTNEVERQTRVLAVIEIKLRYREYKPEELFN